MPSRADQQEKQNPETEIRPERNIKAGDFDVHIPELSQDEISELEIKEVINLLVQLQENNFNHSTLPKPIREGKEPISDPENLEKALKPSNKYLAENLTDWSKEQLERVSKEALSTQSPINIQIDLPSFNLKDAQVDDSPAPNFFDYLFLKQVRDYLEVFNNYPHGVNLTFDFDNTGESWVFGEILDPEKIAQAQSAHFNTLSTIIKKLFPDEDFPEFDIQINSEDESKKAELNTALINYREIEKIIIEKNVARFESIFERRGIRLDWQGEYSQSGSGLMRDDFYKALEEFAQTYMSDLKNDENGYELFRPTPRQISHIAASLEHQLDEKYYNPGETEEDRERNPESEIPTSGFLHKETIQELTRRFIARELLLNKQITSDSNVIHISPGDTDIHKKVYRRRRITLKQSFSSKSSKVSNGHPQFEQPKISFTSYVTTGVRFERATKKDMEEATVITINMDGIKFNLPIDHYYSPLSTSD